MTEKPATLQEQAAAHATDGLLRRRALDADVESRLLSGLERVRAERPAARIMKLWVGPLAAAACVVAGVFLMLPSQVSAPEQPPVPRAGDAPVGAAVVSAGDAAHYTALAAAFNRKADDLQGSDAALAQRWRAGAMLMQRAADAAQANKGNELSAIQREALAVIPRTD